MPQSPFFSIVIPAYNVERYILKALESAERFRSSDRDLVEIIVVDDASRDGTSAVLRQHCSLYDRLVKNDTNRGLSVSRSIGYGLARGLYVINLDGDDELAGISALELRSFLCLSSLPDVAVFGYERILPDGDRTQPQTIVPPSADVRSNFTGAVWTKVVRRELLLAMEYSRCKLTMSEDLIWGYEVLNKSERIVSTSTILYRYRLNPNSVTIASSSQAYVDSQPGVLHALIELFGIYKYRESAFFFRYWMAQLLARLVTYPVQIPAELGRAIYAADIRRLEKACWYLVCQFTPFQHLYLVFRDPRLYFYAVRRRINLGRKF
jgi:glycosyltransferase involved in cell wall biosynthesis